LSAFLLSAFLAWTADQSVTAPALSAIHGRERAPLPGDPERGAGRRRCPGQQGGDGQEDDGQKHRAAVIRGAVLMTVLVTQPS
jgi:hypothetical protein